MPRSLKSPLLAPANLVAYFCYMLLLVLDFPLGTPGAVEGSVYTTTELN